MTTLNNIQELEKSPLYEGLHEEIKTLLTNLKNEIDKLEDRDLFLEYLEEAGVDNWEGYDDAKAAYYRDLASEY